MRFIVSLLVPVFVLMLASALAQEGGAKKPDARPEPAEKPPATPPAAGNEGKGVRSELLTTGPSMKLSAYPSRYQFLLAEAMKRFQARDFKGAVDYVERADEVLPPTAWSLNVRGAIAIEQRDFDRGLKFCSDALKLDPNFYPAKFNICEIPFLQGRYAEARGLWMKLFAEVRPGDSAAELVIYRIYLTYLLEKDFVQAKDWMDKIPFPSQTPAYQYAHAAWERQKTGDLAKWDDWIRSATYIWPEGKRSEFVDVLIQLGWLKRE
jgi:tetratricopeptide (TPR) repeat protein